MIKIGRCQCGQVQYEIDDERILTLYCCHCLECQKQSASAFAMSMKVQRWGFRLICGELSRWVRSTDSGRINRAHFCPRCGCRVYHDNGDDSSMVSVKAGLLDDAVILEPIGHIWTDRARSWVVFAPNAILFSRQPATYEPLIDEWKRRRSGIETMR